MSNEITMRITCDINELYVILESKGFNVVDKFFLDDTYYVPKDTNIYNMHPREILTNAILLRNISIYIPTEHEIVCLTYKSKDIAPNGDIISQKNIDCQIKDVYKGKEFLNAIGYKEIMSIKENDIVYSKDGLNISIKDIKNGNNLIEVEINENNTELDTIEKVIKKVEKLQIPIDTNDYFVKKAEIELKKLIGE